MSSLIPTFLSNIEYLELNQIPKTISGNKLMIYSVIRETIQKTELQR